MSGCWLWEEHVCIKGYGRIRYRGKKRQAHRVSWIIHRGEIPLGMNVLHKCDVTGCVNPDHLFLGTDTDNARDREQKQRGHNFKGADMPWAKLSEDDIKAIRLDTRSQRTIAKNYGITQSAVSLIRLRKNWRHIPN